MRAFALLRFGLASLVLSGALQTIPKSALAADEAKSWDSVEASANKRLFREQEDLIESAKRIKTSQPTDANEALQRLDVALRLGMNAQAAALVQQLPTLQPALNPIQAPQLFRSCVEVEAWDAAQNVVAQFPTGFYNTRLSQSSIEPLLKHFKQSGRDPQEVDAWMQSLGAGENHLWTQTRVQWAVLAGTEQAIASQLAAEARARRANFDESIAMAMAIAEATDEPLDWSWVATELKPQGMLQTYKLARLQAKLKLNQPAVENYRKALSIQPTRQEISYFTDTWQGVPGAGEDVTPSVRAEIRHEFINFLKREKLQPELEAEKRIQAQEEPKWRAEAAAARTRGVAYRAARAETAGPQPEPKQIEEAEKWYEEAQRLRQVAKPEEVEAAYRKVMELAPRERQPDGKAMNPLRGQAFQEYFRWLNAAQRPQDASRLALEELASDVPDNAGCDAAINCLLQYSREPSSAELDACWSNLNARLIWTNRESGILYNLLRAGREVTPDNSAAQLEQLAALDEPNRTAILGKQFTEHGDPTRGIAMMESALLRGVERQVESATSKALLSAKLAQGDWRYVDTLLPELPDSYSTQELIEITQTMALCAARDQAPSDALRFWKRAANVTPRDLSKLDLLAQAGLRGDLITLYTDWQTELPEATVPAEALKIMHAGELSTPRTAAIQ